jgi:hypothetical protein
MGEATMNELRGHRSPEGPAAGRRRRVVAALRSLAATATVIVIGCAPLRVPIAPIEPTRRAERYAVALERREARGTAVDAQLLIWAEAPAGARLPGAEARLLLAAPDAFRLRVASLFGTALDIGARGESLTAYVPSRRRALMLDAIRDSLGLRQPGRLAFRALTATWRPPAGAWQSAAWDDSLMRVAWLEDGDTLAIAVGSGGLPAWASLARPDGAGVRVDYQAWDQGSGVAWPVRFTIEDREGAFRVAARVARVRFPERADSLRLAVAIPAGAVPLTLAELRRVLERLGAL